jgi:thioredoxin 1
MRVAIWLLALLAIILISLYARTPDDRVTPSSFTEKPELVIAGAAWCVPCQKLHKMMLKQSIKQILKGYDYTHLDYTVEEERKEIDRLKIKLFPTLLIYKSGEQVHRESGLPTEGELKSLLKKNL